MSELPMHYTTCFHWLGTDSDGQIAIKRRPDMPTGSPHTDGRYCPEHMLVAAAETGKVVKVKKGQFLAPWDMKNVVQKVLEAGNPNILVTERGASFGYNTLISDMRALPQLAETGCPVVFDATHSVQQPGGKGTSSGGQREYVPVLARAAVAVGVAALFIETHPDPDKAPSDGPNMVPLKEFEGLIKELQAIDAVVKQ